MTSPFSVTFGQWQHRYEEWQEDSARFFGICRIPTETHFLRQDMQGDLNQNIMHHPFYSSPTAIADARNIWVLPAAPPWWHDALWKLGRNVDGFAGAASSDAADDSQGDLRWRFFRAAGELKSITGCSLTNCRPIVVIHANLRETNERAWAR